MGRQDMGNRPDKWRLTLEVNGQNFGVWSKQSGGSKDSDEVKHSPGGMAEEESLGGKTTHGNPVLQRLYDHDIFLRLDALVGPGEAKVRRQPLDSDGIAYGESAIAWEGKLKRLDAPEVDSDSSSQGSFMEVEISARGRSVS